MPHAVHRFKIVLRKNIFLLQKTSLLSVENTLCVVKESLIPLLEAMAVPGPGTNENIKHQWSKITLLSWEQISSTQSFWCEVHSYRTPVAKIRSPS
ncbi:unnamed protein product [Ixodes pacificus]